MIRCTPIRMLSAAIALVLLASPAWPSPLVVEQSSLVDTWITGFAFDDGSDRVAETIEEESVSAYDVGFSISDPVGSMTATQSLVTSDVLTAGRSFIQASGDTELQTGPASTENYYRYDWAGSNQLALIFDVPEATRFQLEFTGRQTAQGQIVLDWEKLDDQTPVFTNEHDQLSGEYAVDTLVDLDPGRYELRTAITHGAVQDVGRSAGTFDLDVTPMSMPSPAAAAIWIAGFFSVLLIGRRPNASASAGRIDAAYQRGTRAGPPAGGTCAEQRDIPPGAAPGGPVIGCESPPASA